MVLNLNFKSLRNVTIYPEYKCKQAALHPLLVCLEKMITFLSLMFLSQSWVVSSSSSTSPSPQQPKNIFILAGQSNMSGRGGVINGTWDGVVPRPQCQPNPLVFRFSGGLTWVEAKEPLHKDIDVNTTCGISPGMAFANSLLSKKPKMGTIGLVPCAIGGTKISEWGRGTFLYNQLLSRANGAVRNGGCLKAILWYQGESDTKTSEDAKLYKSRLEEFFVNVRDDLNSTSLPVIQVALASGQGPYLDEVRKAQLGIQVAGVKCIDAKGLQLEPDYLHLTTKAEVQLGEMLADAFLQTLPLKQ